MRLLLTALPVLILLVAGNAFGLQGSHEWIKYDSPEGGYSVLLPGQPNLTTQEAATANGEKFPQYMASASDAGAVFLSDISTIFRAQRFHSTKHETALFSQSRELSSMKAQSVWAEVRGAS